MSQSERNAETNSIQISANTPGCKPIDAHPKAMGMAWQMWVVKRKVNHEEDY